MPKSSNAITNQSQITEARAFDNGLLSGKAAADELAQHAPLNPAQCAWLSGFLKGFVDAASRPSNAPVWTPTMTVVAGSTAPEGQAALRASAVAPYTARIAQVEAHHVGTKPGWISVALDVDEGRFDYSPGSTLALWPTNDPEEVRRVLRALGVSAQFTVTTERGSEPAWQVLLERVDMSRTSRQALQLLAEYSRSDSEAHGLNDLAEGPLEQQRALLAVLRRYPSARPPLERLLACLLPLEPSYVPIASSNLERLQPVLFTASTDNEASAWGSVNSALRSKFRVGEWLTVSVDCQHYPPCLVDDDLEPTIVIADGPGIAFARAFVAERRARHAKGRTWVITTGMASLQFPYARTLSAWCASGSMGRLDIAEGADPAHAVELLTRLEEPFWRWIVDHSRVFVVSTRSSMRDAIAQWFLALLAQRNRLDSVAAEQRHSELTALGRWVVLPGSLEHA